MILSEYDISIQYIRGGDNHTADFLSRITLNYNENTTDVAVQTDCLTSTNIDIVNADNSETRKDYVPIVDNENIDFSLIEVKDIQALIDIDIITEQTKDLKLKQIKTKLINDQNSVDGFIIMNEQLYKIRSEDNFEAPGNARLCLPSHFNCRIQRANYIQ